MQPVSYFSGFSWNTFNCNINPLLFHQNSVKHIHWLCTLWWPFPAHISFTRNQWHMKWNKHFPKFKYSDQTMITIFTWTCIRIGCRTVQTHLPNKINLWIAIPLNSYRVTHYPTYSVQQLSTIFNLGSFNNCFCSYSYA